MDAELCGCVLSGGMPHRLMSIDHTKDLQAAIGISEIKKVPELLNAT